MTLSPEEREPYLRASVERALPAYEADRALPEAERQLTADLEFCNADMNFKVTAANCEFGRDS